MTGSQSTSALRRPEFNRLVAFQVYDGPTSGVVFDKATNEPFYFSLQAWDENQERRVFALSRLDKAFVERAIAALSALVEPRWPEWWLQLADAADQREQIEWHMESIATTAPDAEAIVLTKDLLQGAELFRPLLGAIPRSEFAKLSRRTDSVQEVADAPYLEWLHFLQDA
jgi:hypothetical protein